MQLKAIPLIASLFGLLLIWAVPSSAQTDDAQAKALVAWQTEIISQLLRKAQFPSDAIGQAGTARVAVVLDRQGRLVSRKLLESSGSDQLDAAALQIVEQAAPFTAPPAELTDQGLGFGFTVPFNFAKPKRLPSAAGRLPAEPVEEQTKLNAKIHGICRGC